MGRRTEREFRLARAILAGVAAAACLCAAAMCLAALMGGRFPFAGWPARHEPGLPRRRGALHEPAPQVAQLPPAQPRPRTIPTSAPARPGPATAAAGGAAAIRAT